MVVCVSLSQQKVGVVNITYGWWYINNINMLCDSFSLNAAGALNACFRTKFMTPINTKKCRNKDLFDNGLALTEHGKWSRLTTSKEMLPEVRLKEAVLATEPTT